MYLKLAILFGIGALVFGACAVVYRAGMTRVEAEYAPKLEASNTLAKQYQHELARSKAEHSLAQTIGESLRHENDTLHQQVSTILIKRAGIRVCLPASSPTDVPRTGDASSTAIATEGGQSGVRIGDDIEVELVQFAERAEEDRLMVIAWQQYATQFRTLAEKE